MSASDSGYYWDPFKNAWLKGVRGVTFEELLGCPLIKVRRHVHYEHQAILMCERKGYIWVIPFVRSKDGIYLKTAYPSRKWTQSYKEGLL